MFLTAKNSLLLVVVVAAFTGAAAVAVVVLLVVLVVDLLVVATATKVKQSANTSAGFGHQCLEVIRVDADNVLQWKMTPLTQLFESVSFSVAES